MPESQCDPVFYVDANITPLERAVCQADTIRHLTLTYLPDEALSPEPKKDIIQNNIIHVMQQIKKGLHDTPCFTQWRAAGYENVPEQFLQPFGPALNDLRISFGTSVAILAKRTARHTNTVYRWIREEMEPDPLVKKAALASINTEPGK